MNVNTVINWYAIYTDGENKYGRGAVEEYKEGLEVIQF